ncbi:MAG: YIP1 family protein [candidate division WOR-3 bacterium]
MKNFINIFTNPSAVFSSIKEKPEWSKPLMVVLVILSIISILTISTTRDLITAQQIEAMKDRKMTDEQIEQAMKFTSGAFIYVSAIFGTIIGVTVVLLLFALLLNLFIPVAGGEGSYKLVFSVVSYSALIKIPAHLLRWILIMLKHSLQVNTSFALFVPNLPAKSFTYRLLASFDFFIIWEMILVAMGISITNNLKRENAYILVFLIWIASIFLGMGLGGLFGPR